jgi:RecA/RadA recombinase
MPRKKTTLTPNNGRFPKANVDQLFETITADLGGYGVVIQRGADLEGRFDLRRPCGIPSLDIATGGGLPAGGLSQIDGPDGVGKNLLIYSYFAQVQRLYGDDTRIFMLCMEFPFDKVYARNLGFRVPFSDYEIGVEHRRRQEAGEAPLTKEEIKDLQDKAGCGEFLVLRGAAEANLDALVRLIESNAFQIGAVDSWDAMLTAAEDEAELADDPRIASASNVQTKWMKKVQSAMAPRKRCPECLTLEGEGMDFKKTNSEAGYGYYCKCGWKGKAIILEENETTIIGIRQVRANLQKAGMRSREWKVGGSWALKHGKLVDIQIRQSDILMDKEQKNKIGKEITFEITKGKAGTHEGKTGTFKYYFEPPEVDIESDILNYCTTKGIIRRGGAVYYIGDEKFSGKGELTEALADPERGLRNQLWKLMLKDAGLQHVRHRDVEG